MPEVLCKSITYQEQREEWWWELWVGALVWLGCAG